jgi:hypothetical protein
MGEHIEDHRAARRAKKTRGDHFPDGLATEFLLGFIDQADVYGYRQTISDLRDDDCCFEEVAEALGIAAAHLQRNLEPPPVGNRTRDLHSPAVPCEFCAAPGHASKDCKYKYGPTLSTSSSLFCDTCNHTGHIALNCPREQSCECCGIVGHRAYACKDYDRITQHPKRKISDLLAPECEYCGSHEHLSGRCDEEPQCNLCGRGGHRSKNCTACPICNAFGHKKHQCPVICDNCGNNGHRLADCQVVPKCTLCNGTGHWMNKCPNNEHCRNCGLTGHTKSGCLVPKKK